MFFYTPIISNCLNSLKDKSYVSFEKELLVMKIDLNYLLFNYFLIYLILCYIFFHIFFIIFYNNRLVLFDYLKNYYIFSSIKKKTIEGFLLLEKFIINHSIYFLSGFFFLIYLNLKLQFDYFVDILRNMNSYLNFYILANILCLVIIYFFLYYFLILKKNIKNINKMWLNVKKQVRVVNSEFFLVLWFSFFSFFLLLYTINLIYIFIGLELLSLTFYILISSKSDSLLSIESSIKYLVLSSLSAVFLLFSLFLIYFLFGTLNLTEIYSLIFCLKTKQDFYLFFLSFFLFFLSLSFKFGFFPFHTWVPDVYEGASLKYVIFISLLPKLIYLIIFFKFLFFMHWLDIFNYSFYIFIFFGVFSLIIGTFGALNQYKIKRFLGYSSISHVSYLLFSFFSYSYNYSFFISFIYLLVYIILSFSIFSILIFFFNHNYLKISLLKFSFYNNNNFLYSLIWIFSFLSLAGIPPFIGFFSKFLILQNLILSQYYLLFILILFFSSVSIYYYLRFIIFSFFSPTIFSLKKNIHIWYILKNDYLLIYYLFLYFFFFNFFGIFFINSFLELIYFNLFDIKLTFISIKSIKWGHSLFILNEISKLKWVISFYS